MISSVKYIIPVATGNFSSKTGSLARKRELREMLEQQDEGYEDDAFEGTPFRSKKVSKVMQVLVRSLNTKCRRNCSFFIPAL